MGESLLPGVVYIHESDGDTIIPSIIPPAEKPILIEMENDRYYIVGPLTALGRKAVQAYRRLIDRRACGGASSASCEVQSGSDEGLA